LESFIYSTIIYVVKSPLSSINISIYITYYFTTKDSS